MASQITDNRTSVTIAKLENKRTQVYFTFCRCTNELTEFNPVNTKIRLKKSNYGFNVLENLNVHIRVI